MDFAGESDQPAILIGKLPVHRKPKNGSLTRPLVADLSWEAANRWFGDF
jgi:hypothetical protein